MEKIIHDNIQSFDTIASASEREVNILIVKVEELLSKIRLLAAHEKRESVAKIQILKSRVMCLEQLEFLKNMFKRHENNKKPE